MSENKPLIEWQGPGWYGPRYNTDIQNMEYLFVGNHQDYKGAQYEAVKCGLDMASWFDAPRDDMRVEAV